MTLRNKLAILSFTLMSLMTIPTLAEKDTYRIDTENFIVQIDIPEGWNETDEFNQAIPNTFKLGDQTFHGKQFKNGTPFKGCAVFAAVSEEEADDSDDKVDLEKAITQFQLFAFPGAKPLKNFSFSKGSFVGIIEGYASRENENPSKIKFSGALGADSAKGAFAEGGGQIIVEGTTPFIGTTAIRLSDDYQIVVVMWGSDEKSQIKEAKEFLDAVTVTLQTQPEPITEPVNEVVVKEVVSEITEV